MRVIHDLSCSVQFVICCLFLFGCSSPPPPSPAQTAFVLDELKSKFGTANSEVTGPYFHYVTQRLSEALHKVGRDPVMSDIVILNVREPLAFSPGPVSGHRATIVLSRGLVRRLQVEAELAFVIAHELGHLVLNHHADVGRFGVPEYRRDLEDEADRFAVGLLAGSGYDPHFASHALLHAYDRNEPSDPLYPDLDARIANIRSELASSGWKPPGTIDRRDFQRLRRMLS